MAAISIGDPDEAPPARLASYARKLRLEFLDGDWDSVAKWGFPPESLCSLAQVARLEAAIRQWHALPEQLRLVAHCRMGVSRSAAVVLLAEAITGCWVPRAPEANFANQHVLQLAEQLCGRTFVRPPEPNGDAYCYLPSRLAI